MVDQNLDVLRANSYPGRGMVIGIDETGRHAVQIYWLMGRSANSRNRVLSIDGSRVFTEPANIALVQDPSLIIYTAMRNNGNTFVVSNGAQTDGVMDSLNSEKAFKSRMRSYSYEPDAPNFTPRITGVFARNWYSQPFLALHIIRKSEGTTHSIRCLYSIHGPKSGLGNLITTYTGDGDPLPSFVGKPLVVPLYGGIDEIANCYWTALDQDNRIALAVKFIGLQDSSLDLRVINKYKKV